MEKGARGFRVNLKQDATETKKTSGIDRRLKMAGWTGLEPAAFCVTGRRSNQLSYHPNRGKEARP